MSRITLQDIADHTGLSKFAVSCSLSGKPGVSDTTRKRVQDAAVQLGYQRLKPAEERREITLIFHDQVDSVSYELRTMLQDGMQREAHRLGQPVRLQWTHDANRVEAMVKDSAGIILVGPHEQKTLDILRASGVPVVRLGWVAPPRTGRSCRRHRPRGRDCSWRIPDRPRPSGHRLSPRGGRVSRPHGAISRSARKYRTVSRCAAAQPALQGGRGLHPGASISPDDGNCANGAVLRA